MIPNLPILNREIPADGWYHLVPLGEFPHPDTGLIQVLDDTAIDAMVNAFKPRLLIDQEHWSYDPDKSSEAFGWVDEVQKRAEGLWGKSALTDLGQPAIKNGRYRYISPVWFPNDCQKLGNNRIRPLRLDSLGLTNNPNLKGMVPLTNRAATPAAATQGTDMKDKLGPVLGLAVEAADASFVEAVTALKNRTGKLEADVTKITGERDALLTEQVEKDLEEYKDVISNRDTIKKQLLANRADTIELLKGLKAPAKPALHNRAGKATPATGKQGNGAGDDKQEIANKQNAAVIAIKNRDKCSFAQAWSTAKSEQPALFAAEQSETAAS